MSDKQKLWYTSLKELAQSISAIKHRSYTTGDITHLLLLEIQNLFRNTICDVSLIRPYWEFLKKGVYGCSLCSHLCSHV